MLLLLSCAACSETVSAPVGRRVAAGVLHLFPRPGLRRPDRRRRRGGGADVRTGGVADLYLSGKQQAFAFRGQYSYDGQRMKLRFQGGQILADADFAIDPADDNPSLPFRIFSTDAGSSTWRRAVLPLENNAFIAYNTALFADGADVAGAITSAYQYLTQVVRFTSVDEIDIGTASTKPPPTPCDKQDRCYASVEQTPTGLIIHYQATDPFPAYDVRVAFYDWIAPGEPAPLTTGPLVGDLHIDLPTNSPVAADADPADKRALFIMPFRHKLTTSYVRWDLTQQEVRRRPGDAHQQPRSVGGRRRHAEAPRGARLPGAAALRWPGHHRGADRGALPDRRSGDAEQQPRHARVDLGRTPTASRPAP